MRTLICCCLLHLDLLPSINAKEAFSQVILLTIILSGTSSKKHLIILKSSADFLCFIMAKKYTLIYISII